jgi:transmembrane sensor
MEEDRIIELLTRKLAGESSEDELDELDELFHQYPENAYLQDIFLEIWKTKAEEEDPEMYYKRHRRRHQDDFGKLNLFNRPERVSSSRVKNFFLTTAAVLLLMTIATYLYFDKGEKISKQDGYTEIICGKGVRKSVTLPDGSRVWLNADSRIAFDANMNATGRRIVELSGEAYFDVKHIDEHPFFINTRQVSIKVLGTAFNVRAYPGDRSCETTLIRGSIELVTNNKAKQKFLLIPSEKLSVTEAKTAGDASTKEDQRDRVASMRIELVTPVKLSDKEYVPETSWTENKLIFKDEPLEQLAPELERWYDVKIEIANESLRGYRFTGVFTSETILQALTAMKLIKPFKFTINDKNIKLY